MQPSSFIHCIAIEVAPLFYSSLWMAIASSRPCGGTAQELPSRAGADCAREEVPGWGLLLQSVKLSFNVSLPWFQGEQAMGEGWTLLIIPGPSPPCFLSHPQVCSGTCPSRRNGQGSSGGAFILGVGPATVHANNNNVFNGLPGLKAIWISCRNVFNSLSRAEGLSLQRCLQRKRC